MTFTRHFRRILTFLAYALTLLVVLVPSEAIALTPAAFVRIPVEVIVCAGVMLVLPSRPRRICAWSAGLILGVLAIVKIVSLGFSMVLDRQFDPIIDAPLLKSAVIFLQQSDGWGAAIAAVIAAVLAAALVLAAITLTFTHLGSFIGQHRAAMVSAAGALGATWVTCILFGAHIVPGVPIAAHDYYNNARSIYAGWNDREEFATDIAFDPIRNTPSAETLSALRGKNVLVVFVESYGKVAIEDPEISPPINKVLENGDAQLRAAGFSSRSAFLSSPTAGGGSWLAQSTLLSGLWVKNQQRYRQLTSSNRLTLTRAFQRADWRTVAVSPATTLPWPEADFFGYDKVYAAKELNYQGPRYSFASIPDQYTLATLHRSELTEPGPQPVMAAVALLSSHAPWKPVPQLMAWEGINDGSTFRDAAAGGASTEIVLGSDRDQFRSDYRHAISYSLESVISYIQRYGDDNLVTVFLGDHQPAPIVTGPGARRDVPITIVARDKAVMDRIAAWSWNAGLKPEANAPVWQMDTFRDRFLTTFSGP